jgi:hypothetical protein
MNKRSKHTSKFDDRIESVCTLSIVDLLDGKEGQKGVGVRRRHKLRARAHWFAKLAVGDESLRCDERDSVCWASRSRR